MKNIMRIFSSDAKRIKTNVVAMIMIIGLSVLPCLYAWFNILSNWDPYGSESVSNIRVAVASEDDGISLASIDYNIGDTVLEGLEGNDSVGWVFLDTKAEALEAVKSGDCYAAIVIPEDFSEDMLSFMVGEMEHPTVEYYRNEKKNAIAPKITDKVRNAVELQINEQFISTLAEAISTASSVVLEDSSVSTATGTSTNIIDVLYENMTVADAELETLETIFDSVILVCSNASDTASTVDDIYPSLNSAIQSGQDALDSLEDASNVGMASMVGLSGLGDVFDGASDALSILADALDNSTDSMSDLAEVLNDANTSLTASRDGIVMVRETLADRLEMLDEIRTGDSYEMIYNLFSNDAESIGEFLASPVAIETEAIYPVSNYGSAMAPFYTVLSLWVGSLFAIAVIHVRVDLEPAFIDANRVEKFFGRYMVFFLLGQIQALIVSLGDILYIGIQCEHPFLFWLSAAIMAFSFSMLNYSLTVALGNLGQGAVVILLVIQVAGAGCTFPIETLPTVFQKIFMYLPFTYAMGAMKECVAGIYGSDLTKDLIVLLLYCLLGLFIGLILAIPGEKLTNLIERDKKGSGVMI